MTTDQQIEQLKWAAVARGCEVVGLAREHMVQGVDDASLLIRNERGGDSVFAPHISHADSDLMGAKLEINTWWGSEYVGAKAAGVETLWKYFADHNNSKSQALLAARMAVAEQIGRMKGEAS